MIQKPSGFESTELPSMKHNAQIHKVEKSKQSPVPQDKIYNQYSISNK
jgi:hypothetical protein